MKISRLSYTKIFLKQKGWAIDDANVKLYMYRWWYSHRSKKQGGLRLSLDGFEFLTNELGLTSYEINFQDSIDLSPHTLLFFDRNFDSPYLLTNRNIHVFTEKKNFELHLFSNDIQRYGLVKALQNQKKEE